MDDAPLFFMRYSNPGDALSISNIARQYFPEELILDIKEIKRWMEGDVNCFRVLIGQETSRVSGYYAILPVNDSVFESLKNQAITERDIRKHHIKDIRSTEAEALYILDFAKLEEATGGALMIRDMNTHIAQSLNKNTKIQKIGTWAFTEKGQAIARAFRFTKTLDYQEYDGTGFYQTTRKEFLGLE